MDEKMRKLVDRFDADFHEYAGKATWEPKDITMMKDLQKLMYYIEVRCGMKEADDRRDYEYNDDDRSYDMSYARGGRGGSGRRYYNGPSSYSNTSGRRYYDDERESAIRRLRKLMDSESNQEIRMAMQNVINELEER